MSQLRRIVTAVVPALICLTSPAGAARANQTPASRVIAGLVRADESAPPSCRRALAHHRLVVCEPGRTAAMRLTSSDHRLVVSGRRVTALTGPPLVAGVRVVIDARDLARRSQLAVVTAEGPTFTYRRFLLGAARRLRATLVVRLRAGRAVPRLLVRSQPRKPVTDRWYTYVRTPPAAPQLAPPPAWDPGPTGIEECGAVVPVDALNAADFDQFWHLDRNGPGWTGGDGTISTPLRDGRVAWSFGDTFIGGVQPDGRRAANWQLIRNAIVVQDKGCLRTFIGGTPGSPAALLRPSDPSMWWWPAGAIEAEDRDALQLVLLRVMRTGATDWDFTIVGVDRAEVDLGSMTATTVRPLVENGSILWGACVLRLGGDVYIYGVENRPLGGRLYLARTDDPSLLGTWTYFAGHELPWTSDPAGAAPLPLDDPSGSQSPLTGVTSVSVVPVDDGYELVSQEPNFGTGIFAWAAAQPMGPFSAAGRIATVAAPSVPGAFTYNAHLHPEFAADGLQLLSYDVNGGDIMADATLYRPRFLALAWPTSLPSSPASSLRATPRSVAMP